MIFFKISKSYSQLKFVHIETTTAYFGIMVTNGSAHIVLAAATADINFWSFPLPLPSLSVNEPLIIIDFFSERLGGLLACRQ